MRINRIRILTRFNCKTNILSSSIATNPYFTINSETGIITTTDTQIDRESITRFNVTVSVQDLRGFNDQTELSVCVCDINDNAPVFTSTFDIYRTTIGETAQSGSTFYTTILANDADEHPSQTLDCGCPITTNAVLEYTQTSGDTRFSVDRNTGEF